MKLVSSAVNDVVRRAHILEHYASLQKATGDILCNTTSCYANQWLSLAKKANTVDEIEKEAV